MPSASPNTVAIRKPARVVHSVTNELSKIGLRYCHSAANTSEGAGRMVSGTSSALQIASQTRNSATTKAAGETTLIANSRLSTADQAAQRVHDVLELLRVGDFEIARPRNRHLTAAHDAAGAARHHVHRVGEEYRLAQVVRDEQHRHLAGGLQVAQREPQLLAREGVERAERLVEQQDLGLVDQRAADRGALLHAARELPRMLFHEARESDRLEQCFRLRGILLLRKTAAVRLDDLQ